MNLLRYRTPSLNDIAKEMGWLAEQQWAENNDVSNATTSAWAPRVDIQEKPSCYLLIADLPGVDPKQVKVEMHNGVLTIEGEKVSESKEGGADFLRVERCTGNFYRRFSFPDTVDSEGISAKCQHGVLEITIPKIEKAQKRRIEIST